jgi:histidinol dehydrogenase
MLEVIELEAGFNLAEVKGLYRAEKLLQADLVEKVAAILEDIRRRGDTALFEYTERFDGVKLDSATIKVSPKERAKAKREVRPDFIRAIKVAKARIEEFHYSQLQTSWSLGGKEETLGQLVRPLERVGLYVPGGKAAYPSTVLMTGIPAKVAGVAEIAMCVPAPIRPEVLVAAEEVGVREIYKVGGAQAIAALAFGTESVKKVDKIVGPGNIYVTIAKKLVFGEVDIDMLAGPSEVLIIADTTAKPSYIAADLLAQAEHDREATAVLITVDKRLAEQVSQEVKKQLLSLTRYKIAKEALEQKAKIFVVSSLSEAIDLANELAPEHLELIVKEPFSLLSQIKNAGAIFLGSNAPEAIGDYIAGPNHVLPTSGTARYFSPLGVYDFLKKTSTIYMSAKALANLAKEAIILAESEGLDAHAKSIKIRLES